jgi:hypothetical protein
MIPKKLKIFVYLLYNKTGLHSQLYIADGLFIGAHASAIFVESNGLELYFGIRMEYSFSD